jgi:pimeloyl-ACP methyl ester carboxylesterase
MSSGATAAGATAPRRALSPSPAIGDATCVLETHIRFQNRRIAFAQYGDPTGRPVFLCHGTPSSRLNRPDDETTRALGARLIVIDRPGCGRSDFLPRRTLLDWPRDLAAVADGLGIESFAVVGFSGGGPYVAASAHGLPHRIVAACSAAGAGPVDAPNAMVGLGRYRRMACALARHAPLVFRAAMWLTNHPGRNPNRFFEKFMRDLAPPDQAIVARTEIRDKLVATYAESVRNGLRGVALDLAIAMRPWGFPLGEIRCPYFIWHGDDDRSTPIAMARYLAQTIPACHATFLPDAGHMFFYDRWPDILKQLLATW